MTPAAQAVQSYDAAKTYYQQPAAAAAAGTYAGESITPFFIHNSRFLILVLSISSRRGSWLPCHSFRTEILLLKAGFRGRVYPDLEKGLWYGISVLALFFV